MCETLDFVSFFCVPKDPWDITAPLEITLYLMTHTNTYTNTHTCTQESKLCAVEIYYKRLQGFKL